MMRALLLPLTAILALATGLGLLGVAATLSPTPVTVVPAVTADASEPVRRFYAAADEALRTGDTTALQGAIATGYIDHASPIASRTGIAGYVQFLAEVRAACPDCQLVVEELAMGHDQAAIRVTARGHQQGTTLGVSVDGLPLTWSSFDVLRIAGGQVAERWSWGDPLPLTQPLFADVTVGLPAGPAVLKVERLISRPGAGLPPLEAQGPMLLVVEVGALSVGSDGAVWVGQSRDVVRVDAVVRQGERLVFTPGLLHTVRNDGPSTVVELVMAIDAIDVLPPQWDTFPH